MSNGTVNEHCKPFKTGHHVGNDTVPTWSSIVSDSWKGPIRIEVLASLAALVLMFLATFGSHHRHRGNKFIQKVLLGAYTLSSSLLTYILGSMQSSSVKSSMYPFWAISLVALYGCTDSITAYILDSNRQGVEFLYQIVLCYAYTLVIFITTWLSDGFYVATLPALLLCLTAVHKCWLRRLACRLASRSSDVDRTIADYMSNERGTYGPGAPSMEDCRYLVDWPLSEATLDVQTCRSWIAEDPDEVIDVGKVWRYKRHKSLSPEQMDACLSFSLFHLLRRRFFGFFCGASEEEEEARDFVFRRLLSENRDDGRVDYNRVFMVIEVELAFMYDFFFTKYAALYYGLTAATFWSLASAICILVSAYAAAARAFTTTRCDQAVNTKTDAVITLLLLACAALVELLQPLLYWTTIWGRVSFACQCIRNERRISRGDKQLFCSVGMTIKDRLTKIGVHCTSNTHYWQHKLGQYSFLDSVSYHEPNNADSSGISSEPMTVSKWRKIMASLRRMLGTPDGLIGQSNAHTLEVRRKPAEPIKLSDEVKKAVVDRLKQTAGNLTRGKMTLLINGAHHLLWACHLDVRSEDTISTILIWHIATCYVEMGTTACQNEGVECDKLHRDVATQLSKYCAYLLVSAPKLLPGHETDSKLLFDAAAREANKFLLHAPNKYDAMRSIGEPPSTSVFATSVKLGRQLEEMPEGTRWQLLADFWAEMLLYSAPSNNVKEHIEQLAKGGEFITHLWALLSHAGILEREVEYRYGGV